MASTRFYLKDRGSFFQIFLYFSYQGKRIQFYTGEKLKNKNHWDKENQRVKSQVSGAKQINDLLSSMKEEMEEVYREARIMRKKVKITSQYLKNTVTFRSQSGNNFFEIYDLFVSSQGKLNDWSVSTNKKFTTLKNHLEAFGKSYHLEFDSINETFLNRFNDYFLNKDMSNTTIEKNLKLFNWFMNWATRQGHNSNLAFKNFKLSKKKVARQEPIFLTWKELVKIKKLDFKNDLTGMEKARDVFLFGCFTGLRYSDIKNLKKTDLADHKLTITTVKTSQQINIPLNVHAREIALKYADSNSIYALPVISNQKFNEHLKKIAEKAGIKQPITKVMYSGSRRSETTKPKHEFITSHVARRTFICNGVNLGIPLEVMIEYTGQSLETIKVYYSIQEDQKDREMEKFNLKVV